MPIIPQEISKGRKIKSSVYRKRNKLFGNYAEFKAEYETNEVVLEHMFRARYSKSIGGCLACGKPFSFYKKIPNRLAYACSCKKSPMIFPLQGTSFEKLKKPLTVISDIIYEMFCSKHGFTATQIDRKYNDIVKKNETSHLLLDRISQAMGIAIFAEEFRADSIIEVDEVYPYVETGLGPYFSFKRGLGSERLQTVVTFTERRSDGTIGVTKAIAVEDANSSTLARLFREHTKPTNIIFTDGSKIYNFLKFNSEFKDYFHQECNHKRKEYVNGDCHVNTVEGFNSYVKKTIHSVYLGVSKQKVQLYLNRVAFNFSFCDRTIFEVMDIIFKALPPLNENIPNRVKCNRTDKKWLRAA